MRHGWHTGLLATLTATLAFATQVNAHGDDSRDDDANKFWRNAIQVGARPSYLVDGMDAGRLKSKLEQCKNGPFYKTDFSIGHRGAPLQFPEHTKESYEAAARMGAGIVECDVTFTK